MKIGKPEMAVLTLMAALAACQPSAALAEETTVKDAAKQAARDAREMGKKVGKTAKQVGQDIGRASTRTYKTIKKKVREDVGPHNVEDEAPTKNAGDRK